MTKTTCNGHRTHGTYRDSGRGLWVCRVCDQPQAWHESNLETLARRAREAA